MVPTPAVLFLWAAAACATAESTDSVVDDSADAGALPDPATVPLAGECDLADDRGGVEVVEDGESTWIDGKVADAVVPTSVLEPLVTEGGCTLWRRNNPFCDPACNPGTTCTFEGTCVDYPLNQDLGTVQVRGLASDVELTPIFPGNTYSDTTLAHPSIVAGATVELAMPGGVYGPATLYGVGIEPLTPLDAGWTVAEGVALAVSWAPPEAATVRSEVVLSLSVDQHGITPGAVRCVFADTGSAEVPAPVVSALVSAGVTGFPSGALERRTADHAAAGEGCMDLQVRSPRAVEVDVAGHTPCVTDKDCPDGQDCDEELQTCR